MGGAVFPPCCLTWGQTMVEVMKIMATFKRSHAGTAALSAPDPAAAYCWPTPSLETPGHSQASLGQFLVGSLLLSPGSWWIQGFICALQESVSLVLCKFWWLCCRGWGWVGWLMVTSSKSTSTISRSTPPRALAHGEAPCWPVPLQETLKHNSGSVSVGSLGPGEHKIYLSPPRSPVGMGFNSKYGLPLLPSCWGFFFALGRGISFFGGIQHSPVNGCSAVSCNFGVLAEEDVHTSFYSTILWVEKSFYSVILWVEK